MVIVAAGCGVGLTQTLGGGSQTEAQGVTCSGPPTLQGKPAALRADAAGLFLWHDRGGWHLRAVARRGQAPRVYVARISGVAVRRARIERGERGDRVTRVGDGVRIRTAVAGRDADEARFSLGCGAASFQLRRVGGPVSARTINLGRSGTAPAAAFTAPAPPARSGVRGRVTLGPACPVEGGGQDCRRTPYPTTVDVARGNGGSKQAPQEPEPVASVRTDGEGRFEVALEPGGYRLTARPRDAATARPIFVTVDAGLLTDVIVEVDSGIRGPAVGAPVP